MDKDTSIKQAHLFSMGRGPCGTARRCGTLLALATWLALDAVLVSATEADVADRYVDCSAYFFMAANAKAMGEFNNYYTAGEFAFNQAVRLVGERDALKRFNSASTEINELIERRWVEFEKADNRYGVVCADILREVSNPDR